jgi:hypothetical protein
VAGCAARDSSVSHEELILTWLHEVKLKVTSDISAPNLSRLVVLYPTNSKCTASRGGSLDIENFKNCHEASSPY